MSDKKLLTQKQLKEILSYCPETGVFTWKQRMAKKTKIGGIAGTINDRLYRIITINGALYRAHRLAWLYMTGEFPEDDLDHKDGDRDNNSFNNLRQVTNQENQKNKRIDKRNNTGIYGVSRTSNRKKWSVKIGARDHYEYLGVFDDFFEACCVRKSAEFRHGYHENHGK